MHAALRRGRPPQLQELHPDAGGHDAGPLCLRRYIRRRGHEQSMAAPVFDRMGISRSHGPVREEPRVDNGWRRLRADSDDDCRETVEKANELHATGDLFAKQIEPEPAPKTLWNGP